MTFQPVAPRDDLGRLEGYHSPQVDCAVRLNTNESPFPPPLTWQEQLADEVASIDFHRYPDREAKALRAAIAQLHHVDAANVFVANGSNEVLQTLCLTYGGPGRIAATFEPTYAMHGQIARVTGTKVITMPRGDGFTLTEESVSSLLQTCTPNITFVCSPNNPTGELVSDAVLESVLTRVPGLIVVDEAYGQFAPRSAQRFISESANLVVVRTFSKTWAMAGQRLGYCIGPTWLIEQLHHVVLPYHLDVVKQAAGRLALRFEDDMRVRVEQLVAERNRLQAALVTLGSSTSMGSSTLMTVYPSSANFILFRLFGADTDAARSRAQEVWEALVARGVLVRNCGSWPGLEGCLRVSVGTPEEDDVFLKALTEVLEIGQATGGGELTT